MERLEAMAGEREWLVLAGRAAEFERELPFGVLVDALDDHLASLDHRRVERVGGERLAELAAIFPALDGPAVPDGALQAERYRAHRAIQELLDGLAVGRPLLLVLDDLHWADQASLEVVASLLRRPPDGPVLLACAFRPSPAPQFLESALAVAEREGRATRVDLGPLAPEDAAELLAEIPEPGVRDAVLRVSRRQPVLPLPARPPGRLATPGSGEARPAGHVHAWACRSPSCRCSPRRSAGCRPRRAACSRRPRWRASRSSPTSPPRSRRSPRRPSRTRSTTCSRATSSGPTDVPRQFRFRHPLVRRAVYAHAGGGWRLAAHARAAAALKARGASASAQAHHVEHAARRGDEAAIALLREAAAASAPRAPATSARWLQAAAAADARGRIAPGRRAPRRAADRPGRGTARRGPARAVPGDARAGDRAAAAGRSAARPARRLLRHRRALARPPRRGPRAARRGARRPGRGAHGGRRAAAARAGAALPLHARLRRPRARGRRRPRRSRPSSARRARRPPRPRCWRSPRRRPGGRTRRASSSRPPSRRSTRSAATALADQLQTLWHAAWAELHLEAFEAGLAHLGRGIGIAPRRGPRRPAGADAARPGARRCSCSAGTADAATLTDEAMETARGAGNPHHVVWASVGGRAGSRSRRATTRGPRCSPRRPRTSATSWARRCSRRPSRRGRSAPRCSRRARSTAGARRCSTRSAARTRRA